MASLASVLAWRIPPTEEPGGLSPQAAESTAQETQSLLSMVISTEVAATAAVRDRDHISSLAKKLTCPLH